jgi:hypothetical protein
MSRNYHNLDTLEKEIYRLQLRAKNTRDELNNNFEYLQDHYTSMTMNSVFSRSSCRKEKLKEKIISSIWENEKIHDGLDQIIERLADKTSDGIENLLNKIFHKKISNLSFHYNLLS